MAVVGIVAEYDPFHLGHARHIDETRRLLGEDAPVVAVLSGSWKQRGECALADKWTRTALALRGGADLVLELPAPWALSSAEGFARGAVETLCATGVVDTLSFGSECGDVEQLSTLAQGLEGEEYRQALALQLKKGLPFAAARQRAMETLPGGGERASLLSKPNNNLGVEYLRALKSLNCPISPMTVKRVGPDHDGETAWEGYASASLLRQLARGGEWEEFVALTPPGTAETLQRAGIADMDHVDRAVLARLRAMGEEDFTALADSGAAEGLPARLVRAAGEAVSLEDFCARAKTKRYAYARIRRLAVRAFLGLRAEDVPAHPGYLRVLGFGERGRLLLRQMKERATLPILTKPAHAKKLEGEARALFDLEVRCTDLYGLCFDTPRPRGLDYTNGPVRV